MGFSILKACDIHKEFNNGQKTTKVLHGIDIDVYEGEFVSIMGPSGSGKSTLLYILGGLDKPTKGKVHLFDEDLENLNNKQKSKLRRTDIGFIFQFYNLVMNLSVRENILMPVMLDGGRIKEYEEKIDELLKIIGLQNHQHHTPRELSGGQQQRTAIARSLIYSPKLLFADEPIGNLDTETGSQVMELLQKINQDFGTTIIQVTHSMASAEYGSRLVNLLDGKVVEDVHL